MVRTKICGIQTLDDLVVAEAAGTDAVGFLVGQRHASDCFITTEMAAQLCRQAKPFVSTVVVTHIEDPDEIIHITTMIPSSEIQLHSDLSISILNYLRKKIRQRLICKVSVRDRTAVERAQEIEPYADAILLDSIDEKHDQVGGTGKTHDWSISREIVVSVQKPVILAGGLNSQNIGQAIAEVGPWGVDVNSGVTINGRKSAELACKFVELAKNI